MRKMIREKSSALFIAALLLAVLGAGKARAAKSGKWELRSFDDFAKGRAEGIEIGAEGVLRVAPEVEELAESESPYIWSLSAGRAGAVYAGSGNDGAVLKITADGNVEVLNTDTGEVQVHALAPDGKGGILAGVSPGGRIYRIAPGRSELAWETGEVYIWSLAVDGEGCIYAVTGEEGKVLRLLEGGSVEVLYESQDPHVRTLVQDSTGSPLIGTGSLGRLIRIGKDGKIDVIYDFSMPEIVAIAFDGEGLIYAALQGAVKRGKKSENNKITVVSSGKASAVVKVAEDGVTSEVWSSKEERVYSLIHHAKIGLLFGTGDEGRVYKLHSGGEVSVLFEASKGKVTAMVVDPEGNAVFATSNPGTIYRMRPRLSSGGTYVSDVLDSAGESRWGRISLKARVPAGTSLRVHTRTGRTQEPDSTWSGWERVGSGPQWDGSPIPSPAGRFLQIRVDMESRKKSSPEIDEITVHYRRMNYSPELEDLEIHPPHKVFDKSTEDKEEQGATFLTFKASKKKDLEYLQGWRSVSWKGEDPDGDKLSFDVFLKYEESETWLPVAVEMVDQRLSWDARTLPDGEYKLKVVASDKPSNPAGTEKKREKVSGVFTIDNTPPSVDDITWRGKGGTYEIAFKARDRLSGVRKVEFSVMAAGWRVLEPLDGINDSKEERYLFEVAVGEEDAVVAIRVTDEYGNIGTGKVFIR